MKVGIIHTANCETCGCAEGIATGVAALGYESVIVDCDHLEEHMETLRQCDLVFDHTDAYRGSSLRRFEVRAMLEKEGIVVAGSSSAVCALCDDKVRSKEVMAKAGVPVPRGIFVENGEGEFATTVPGPYILKSGHEHMSRGLRTVDDAQEALAEAKKLSLERRQPILLEQFITGKEVEVACIPNEDASAFMMLPVLEWISPDGEGSAITEERKTLGGSTPRRAVLHPEQRVQLEQFARAAIVALGVRDYVRFDVRLAEDGTPYFLEANIIPNMEEDQGMSRACEEAGIPYATFIDRLISAALTRKTTATLS